MRRGQLQANGRLRTYPKLEDNAKERLALNAHLAKLEKPQVAIGIKQKIPQTILTPMMAVAASLETVTTDSKEEQLSSLW